MELILLHILCPSSPYYFDFESIYLDKSSSITWLYCTGTFNPKNWALRWTQLKSYHNGFFNIYSKEFKLKCPLDNNEVEDVEAAAVVAEAEVVVGIADPSVVDVVTVVAVDAEGTCLYFFV